MSREDRIVEELVREELVRRRQLWNARLVGADSGLLVQVFACERHALETVLAEAAFAHAPGMNRGEYLRLELEPCRHPGMRS